MSTSTAKKTVTHTPEDAPLTDAEQDALQALGWQPAGGGVRQGGIAYIRAQAPDGTRQERPRGEWRAIIAAGELAPGAAALTAPTAVIEGEVIEAPLLDEPLGATLELHAQFYLDARRRVGQGILDAAGAVHSARQAARHGQWGPWLRRVGLSDDAAERMLAIHTKAQEHALFAEKVRQGFLSLSVAGEVARSTTADALLERLLLFELPPTVAETRAERRALAAPNSATSRNLAPAEQKFPPDWDDARARAKAAGARLWYNESDGTYTLSERAGHVPRTSSWREILARLGVLETPAEDPPPTDDAEIDGLIADLQAVEARMEAGIADLDDRRALVHIADRADVLRAFNLGTRASELLATLGVQPAPDHYAAIVGVAPPVAASELPAGWRWRDDIPANPADPRPLYQARRADGLTARASHDQREATEHAARSERRTPLAPPPADEPPGPPTAEEVAAELADADGELGDTPPPAPVSPLAAPTPPEFGEWAARAQAVGCALTRESSGYYVLRETDGEASRYAYWSQAMLRVRAFELGEARTSPLDTTTTTTAPAPIAVATADDERDPEGATSGIEDEDGRLLVEIRSAGLSELVSEAILQVAESLRRLALGEAHAVDTPLLGDLRRALTGMPGPGTAVLASVLHLVEGAADNAATAQSRPLAPAAVEVERWPHLDDPDLDELSTDLLGAELASDPPDAGDVARWQDTLDAFAEELSDETYQRLAHRIGALRARVPGRVT